ncbi:Conidiation-specific protein 13 [Cladobotryum mycophilum]|uniref:Conidiation-specific protein 13 n=1 Tax=Cladobotryum mycophilum TaxID=491253 RepID=A0ABR0T405_9HYPO
MVSSKSSNAAKLLAAAVLVGESAAALNKPLINPPIPSMDNGLFQYLKPTHSTHDAWEWGWIPDICRDRANAEKLNPYDVEVFNVHYDDCSQPWIMCRHHNAPMSQSQMIDLFGRMPVHMRQWVRTITAFPGPRSAYTLSGSGDSVFFGDSQNYPTLFAHEIGHTLDHNSVPGYSGTDFSASQIWLDNYNADSAISDSYAATNQAENFAQETVIALFDKNVPGGVGTIEPNWKQIFHQYATLQAYVGNPLIPGGTCDHRWTNPATVCMGSAAPCGQAKTRRSAESNKPDVSITGIPTIQANYDGKISCNITHVDA